MSDSLDLLEELMDEQSEHQRSKYDLFRAFVERAHYRPELMSEVVYVLASQPTLKLVVERMNRLAKLDYEKWIDESPHMPVFRRFAALPDKPED